MDRNLTSAARTVGAICAAAGLALTLAAAPATAEPPTIPTPEEINAAKANADSTAAEVSHVENLIGTAQDALARSTVAAMRANDAYSMALVTLDGRRTDAANARSRADAAATADAAARKQVGIVAAELYRSGGLNPSVQAFVADDAGTVLDRAAALESINAQRAAAFSSAQRAAEVSKQLREQADQAAQAADDAAKAAEQAKSAADSANTSYRQTVVQAAAQRTTLVGQLATLRNTSVELEQQRVTGLEQQRQQQQFAAILASVSNAAPAQQPAASAPLPNAGSGTSSVPPVGGQASSAGTASSSPVLPASNGNPTPITTPPPAPAPPPAAAPAPAPPPPPAPAPEPAPAPPAPAPPAPSGSGIQGAINTAMSKVGPPNYYQWGGTGPSGFDCSGLVWYSFSAAGIWVPRTATAQYTQAPVHVPLSQAQPGDLVVFGNAGYFYHVGIYIGGGKIVNALNPSDGIAVTPIAWMSDVWPTVARY
ncbi:C40 family peptidase [Sinomonas sp. ASV322]|uniref:C40 family peptidase n=1 Tax=Sinomonas sp. ASV322 TaxID=3041920 RepID=UPI0027DBF1B0|nr:C40 family peptidase [Sinomonas sp. ASV322]MDQ4501247.1 C40 family peptidase [Sinomonas sp. ASV322]